MNIIPHRIPRNQDEAIQYMVDLGISPHNISTLTYNATPIDRGGAGRKIVAIKDLRSLANLGLKEAKEVIDALNTVVAEEDIHSGPSVGGYFYSLDGGTTWEHSFTEPLVRVAVLGKAIKPEKVVVPVP